MKQHLGMQAKTIFAVGALLFLATLRHERDRDPARPPVPGGLRMSTIESARELGGSAGAAELASARRVPPAPLVSLAVGIITLFILLLSVFIDGAPRLNQDLIFHFPSGNPEIAGAQSAIMGTIWVVGLTALITVPLGVGAAIYLEEYANGERWFNRMIELNIQNLAAVPSIVYGILGLAFFVRGFVGARPDGARRGADAVAARAADRDHRLARGDPRGPVVDPPGLARARRHPVADDLAPGAARPASPASPPARSSRCRARSARRRR